MGWGVARAVVLLCFSAAVITRTLTREDILYDDYVNGFSTENETEPTEPPVPQPMPLLIDVRHSLALLLTMHSPSFLYQISNLFLPSCNDGELMVFDGLMLDCITIRNN